MRAVKGISLKQYIFYGVVFLIGFLYQPNWVRDNFWLKADFYDAFPFKFPYLLFLLIYSTLSVGATWTVIRWVKRNL